LARVLTFDDGRNFLEAKFKALWFRAGYSSTRYLYRAGFMVVEGNLYETIEDVEICS